MLSALLFFALQAFSPYVFWCFFFLVSSEQPIFYFVDTHFCLFLSLNHSFRIILFFLSLIASFPPAITVPQLAHFTLHTLTFSLFLVTVVCSWNQEGIFLHGLTLYPLNICLLLSLVVKLIIWCSNVLVILIFLNKNNLVSYLTE